MSNVTVEEVVDEPVAAAVEEAAPAAAAAADSDDDMPALESAEVAAAEATDAAEVCCVTPPCDGAGWTVCLHFMPCVTGLGAWRSCGAAVALTQCDASDVAVFVGNRPAPSRTGARRRAARLCSAWA